MRLYRLRSFLTVGFLNDSPILCENCLPDFLTQLDKSGLRGGVWPQLIDQTAECDICKSQRVPVEVVKMPEDQTEYTLLYKLRFKEFMTHKEIGKELGISEPTARRRLVRHGLGGKLKKGSKPPVQLERLGWKED